MTKLEALERASELLSIVELKERHKGDFTHQLSGGMRQKALIAMALACEAKLLLAGEPTMALDTASKVEIVGLLRRLQKERGFSMIVISRELGVIEALATRAAAPRAGHAVEEGPAGEVIKNPRHPYARALYTHRPPFPLSWICGASLANSKTLKVAGSLSARAAARLFPAARNRRPL
jgi:ABC-type glutathione transport system ATPase component